jgi:hypothetical protein
MHDVELASLSGEFATIADTESLLRAVEGAAAGEASAAR